MSLSVGAPTDSGLNLVQKYLIPRESKWVQLMMTKAAKVARVKNPVVARVIPVACALVGVAMSFFNGFSYLVGLPLRFTLHAVHFEPLAAVAHLLEDVASVARSFIFVSLAMTFVATGMLVPKLIFRQFAPQLPETQSPQESESEVATLRAQLKAREEQMRSMMTLHERDMEIAANLLDAR